VVFERSDFILPGAFPMIDDLPPNAGETRVSLPNGPDLPGWRVAQMWMERPIEFWEECREQFGDSFTVELGSIGKTVLFCHPEAVRQIFQLPTSAYVCRPYNDYYKMVMGERSILLADGSEHRRMRKMVMPSMQRKSFETHMVSIGAIVRETVAGWPEGEVFTPRLSLHLMGLKIILAVVFGTIEDPLARQIATIFENEIYLDLGSLSAWTRFVHLKPRLREMISAEIARRRGQGETSSGTLFDTLIRSKDESGELISDSEIQDHIFTMFVAGVDTTAIALAWALYWVHEDPKIEARLRAELETVAASRDPQAIVELPYLNAVCLETLRMYPVVSTPTGRKLLVDTEIHGQIYPTGVTLLPCTHLVHRRADIYPEPSRFHPDRFENANFSASEYLPFGGGARTCIGAVLAPLEMKIALCELMLESKLTAAHLGPVKPVRHGTLIAPSETYRFVAHRFSGMAPKNPSGLGAHS
jgi:cytochrome P450